MSAATLRSVDVEGRLGRALSDMLGHIRGGVWSGGESIAGVLATHALVETVKGCAVCVIDTGETVRVAGAAGSTGAVADGSMWQLAPSPVAEALAGTAPMGPVSVAHAPLAEALGVPAADELVAVPLRAGAAGNSEPTSLGALLLVRDRTTPLDVDDPRFLLEHASLVALSMLSAAPAHDWARCASTLQGKVDVMRNARLYTEAQAASQAMSSFANLVVHDLRAPLTVLSGYVDLLRDGTFGDAPDSWRRPMELITAKLTETRRLVDDLLLAARLDAGAVPVTIERLDLNEVVERAAIRSEARAGLAGAVIETSLRAGSVTAYADVFHVDRVVDNLVNNAVTYGGSPPWVRLSVDASTPPAIRVEDRGVGISPALHERVFERFFRINHELPGTGFGLHVGRVLAEACTGRLTLERSALGEGSTFRLELPAAELPT